MEQEMKSQESMRDGAVSEGGDRHAVRPLPARKQFLTRSCARCAGLLVSEWYYGSNTTGEHNVETLRCVQCGDRVDPVILQNHIRSSVERQFIRRARHQCPVETAMFDEVV